jgi:GNAT superfamily N-acetyltransferase
VRYYHEVCGSGRLIQALGSMTLPPIEFRSNDCQDLAAFLADRIYEFNSETTGYFDGESFGAIQRDESGTILAGISGFTWGGCCFVSYLWVAEEHRGKGFGSAMLRAFEKNAIDKGCKIALLSSHSFQSPAFYKRMGYEEQASIQDYPVGYSDIFFAKRLAPNVA